MPNPIGPDLFRHLAVVSDPSVAPDGSRAAYTLSWIDPATSESRSRIYRVGLPGADAAAPPPQPQPLTDGNADTNPRYSPDGATLAFLRPAAAEPESESRPDTPRQIWLMPSAGGAARPLTAFPNGVREFAWSPDSRRLAAVADVCPDDGAPPSDTPRVREVRRIRYRHDALGWRGDCHFHIFIVHAGSGATAQLTDGDWDDTAPAWSPGGERIAFVSGRSATRDITATSEVYVVSAADPAPAELPPAELWSDGLADAVAAAWSPDGKRLVAAGAMDDGLMALWQAYWHILEPGRPPRPITDDRIRPCLGYPGIYPQPEVRWIADGDSNRDSHNDGRILFLADAAGQTRLYTLPVPPPGAALPSPVALTDGGEQIAGIAMDATATAGVIVASSPAAPADLYLVGTAPGAGCRRLTAPNDAWLAEHPPAQMEKFVIEHDDFDIECRLYHPPGFDAGRKYPLILEIHGGPNGAFYDAFTPLHQVLAGAGYIVLAVNPRGSSTYGAEFVNAVLGDWGGDDYRDLMASLDAVCNRPYVDTERLGVHGYSYGGYMAAWAIGHSSRFRAAVAGAPCIDLWSMYGASDIATGFGEAQWSVRLAGGMSISRPLVDELAGGVDGLVHRLLQRSPITYAPRVQTPVLLLHGETDVRCPIGQSEQYFQVLKRLGKEVEMARFPGCGHSFLRTGHIAMRQAYLERTLAWFERWL